MKTILVTGAAGFIGAHLTECLLKKGEKVIGIDNMNDYYEVALKESRLDGLTGFENFIFCRGDISRKETVEELFEKYQPELVVNLAAQAGVRYSITNPQAYIEANIIGFFHIIEACRHSREGGSPGVRHLVFASSSSVYGLNRKVPYSTEDKTDYPVSLYAATKKSDELMAHAYAKLYQIPCTGLRFFTVYGPMGRPDMAYFKFADKMVKGEKIQLYNNGDMYRDFTYIDDIIRGVEKVLSRIPAENENGVPFRVYNIGNNKPESLMYFTDTLEKVLRGEGILTRPVEREFLPMQPGDVYQTCADVEEFSRDVGFRPDTPLKEGLLQFARWYKTYRNR